MKKIMMIAFVLALLTLCCPACNKKNDPVPPNTNEFNATVLLTTGVTVTINAKGSKAKIGCTFLGGGNFLSGTNDNNEYVQLGSIYSPGGGGTCVSNPGTYNLICEFRKNVTDPNTRTWSNIGMSTGSITFTMINDHYMEGHFNAVSKCVSVGCGSSPDSVVINGTFKGNY